MPSLKANVLLVGGGAVGTITAVNIEEGGLGAVTLVARSNYAHVSEFGYSIESVDHGKLGEWRPTTVTNRIPDLSKTSLSPFDYIVCTTKNCPDIEPTLSVLISPAITAGHTVIVLIQNGLNIEVPLLKTFPNNIVLSGVSMIDCYEAEPGHIIHEFPDLLYVGPFRKQYLDSGSGEAAAQAFIKMYGAAGRTKCLYCDDVPLARWKKLVFNACLNPICAITGLDDGLVRLADGAVEGIVRPIMTEIVAIARALGHALPDDYVDTVINFDPIDLYLKPSMQCDIEKGNYIEFENLVGEPLREGQKLGLATPNLKTIYELCKMIQWRTKAAKGLVKVPPKRAL